MAVAGAAALLSQRAVCLERKVTYLLALAVVVWVLCSAWRNWRCPACGGYLGQDPGVKACPKCGFKF